MKIVVFGLTISSSWGNGHATLWRGLAGAFARRGHELVFFERDVPYYADNRDLTAIPGGTLVLYSDWADVAGRARAEIATADVAVVTSYCPDGIAASEAVLAGSAATRVFYDLDTPVTLSRIERGDKLDYVGPNGLADFDLVLSYTGGAALEKLRDRLGATRTAPLYGHVDPAVHRPVEPVERFRADLSYLGTYSADRQARLQRLFLDPAARMPGSRFLLGGAQFPPDFPWQPNIFFVRHLPPLDHAAFFCSGRLTLNVTRDAMAAMGWCPSGRLFEAAACGTPILSDGWAGLDAFFEPGREILVGASPEDVADALSLTDAELRRIATDARERTLAEHTSDRRVLDFEAALERCTIESAVDVSEAAA